MDIYREEILENWQNPQNFGKMSAADLVIEQINPLCGDEVTFFFKIKKGKIDKVSFTGSGCAISIASASLLSSAIFGKKVSVISRITGQDVLGLIGGSVAPARLKCAFLALEAIKRIEARVKS
ncbi:iron-sulfur cluster assembly scaffold protein [Candidatus Curtissbacteria bacterium]|nr:iron-sulfur cluster assembly scaffold protein [Candidatus Curtissbacteria bacterium]